jgi:hypothetical protein
VDGVRPESGSLRKIKVMSLKNSKKKYGGINTFKDN